MFASGFASATMVCIVENIFQDGEWAILEWRDPLGLRGCGFFHVVQSKIVFQRRYWTSYPSCACKAASADGPMSPSCERSDCQVVIVELAGRIRDPSNDPLQPLRSQML